MKIKVNSIVANEFFQAIPGQIVDIDSKQAKVLIDSGYAEKVDGTVAKVVKKVGRPKKCLIQ